LTEQTGVNNPLDGQIVGPLKPKFVDIDNDGDFDVFVEGYTVGTGFVTRFLENIGDSITPAFTERMGSSNPFDGELNKNGYSFVDIDGDGDMDCFSGNQAYYSTTNSFFYENTGTASSPTFTLDSMNNPLDSVRAHLIALNPSTVQDLSPHFSFVDIDTDGDMDCFVTIENYGNNSFTDDLWYYENIGTSTAPDFIRNNIDNPFNTVLSYYTSNTHFEIPETITFADTDNDGDQDAIFSPYGLISTSWVFCANEGTPTNADFDTVGVSPIDMASGNGREVASLVDINNDSKLDVFVGSRQSILNPIQFFLNETPTSIVNLEAKAVLNAYPNPTEGILFFDKQVTGTLSVTNLVGQEIINKVLSDENQINLSDISKGMYTLNIKLEDNTMVSKIIFIEN